MKKILPLLCCAALLLTLLPSVAFAAQEQIAFRGFQWYATFPEINEQMSSLTAGYASVDSNETIDSYKRAEWSSMFSDDRVENGGVKGYYSGIPVAGYTADSAILYYMYPFDADGRVARDDNQAQFYCAMYSFEEVKDKQATYDDIKSKLIGLYGDCKEAKTKYYTSAKWVDDTGNIAWMVLDEDLRAVRLAYAAAGSEDRLKDLKDKIAKEAVEAENAKREENATNTNGL